MIEHLVHSGIDKRWWDAQLSRCTDRTWYAQSWVLDIASPGWNALVDRERGALMPLTWRSRMGIHYLYQPFGLQQLGVFAPMRDRSMDNAMLAAVPRRYRYWDIYLHEGMSSVAAGRTQPCTQQVLDVLHDRDAQRSGYSQGHRRNLRKAQGARELLTWDVNATMFTALFRSTTAARYGVPEHSLGMMHDLVTTGVARGEMRMLGIVEDGMLHAAACFVEWEGRAILLKSASNARGQELHAMFLLIDEYLSTAGADIHLLDLAGSNTPSVARFNAGFGARSTVYLHLLRNALPVPLRWLKR